jgi:hypothetical protein
MAKPRTKVIPARKDPSRRVDDSLLVKSAESLGRVIGSLQRQMQSGSKQFTTLASEAIEALPELPQFDDLFGEPAAPPRKPAARRRATRAKTTRKTAASARAKKASASRKRAPSRKSSKKR